VLGGVLGDELDLDGQAEGQVGVVAGSARQAPGLDGGVADCRTAKKTPAGRFLSHGWQAAATLGLLVGFEGPAGAGSKTSQLYLDLVRLSMLWFLSAPAVTAGHTFASERGLCHST
jgi:hypothetical protein